MMLSENVALIKITASGPSRATPMIAFPLKIAEKMKILDGEKLAQITMLDDETMEIKLIKKGPIASVVN